MERPLLLLGLGVALLVAVGVFYRLSPFSARTAALRVYVEEQSSDGELGRQAF